MRALRSWALFALVASLVGTTAASAQDRRGYDDERYNYGQRYGQPYGPPAPTRGDQGYYRYPFGTGTGSSVGPRHGESARQYRAYTRQGNRRGDIQRPPSDIHLVERLGRPYDNAPDWRTYGVTYGLVGPLQRQQDLTFLDNALLVGSFFDHGERVYVYAFDLRGERHVLEVTNGGAILDDRVISGGGYRSGPGYDYGYRR